MKQLYLFTFFLFLFSSIQAQFEFHVRTTEPNENFTIPTKPGESYNYQVRYLRHNDPFTPVTTSNNRTGNVQVTFRDPGIHKITILRSIGDFSNDPYFPAIYFNNSGDKHKIVSIDKWGNNRWLIMENAFYGCENLEVNATDAPNLSQATSLENMFRDCPLVDFSLANWGVNNVTNMSGMFTGGRLSTDNYDATLNAWAALNLASNVTFDAGASAYCMATAAHNTLTNNSGNNWTINDGGKVCEDDKFITTWETTSANEIIELPFPRRRSTVVYNYTIEWGDGTVTYSPSSNALHVYENAGMHKIKISGTFPPFHFARSSMNEKIKAIDQWGSLAWETLESAFTNCFYLDILATDTPNISNVDSMYEAFTNCRTLGTANSLDFSGWNTSNVTDMEGTFSGASKFNTATIQNWNLSSLTTAKKMLNNTGLSIENYDKILQGWATLSGRESRIPRNITLGALNVGYGNPTYRDILRNTYAWTFQRDIYQGIEEDKFITRWTVTTDDLSIPIYMLDTDNNYTVDWGDKTIESGFTGSTSHSYDAPGTYTVKIYGDFSQMSFFNRDGKDKIIAIDQWGTNKWEGLIAAFSGCSNVKLYATDVPDLSEATSIVQAFQNATAFEDVNNSLKDWDVRTITNFSNSFEGTNMNSDISGWNMEAATEIINMFANNSVFNQPIGNWTFNNLEFSLGVFRNATSFNQDLSNWDVSKVRNFESMFNGATAFDQSLGDWDISSAQTGDFRGMDNMFENAGLSTANYDATLLGWASLDPGETKIPTDIILDAGNSTYCIGETSRQNLTTNQNWAITDAGSECDTVAFTTTWETTSPDESITIPTTGTGYNYSIDWGDGTIGNNQTSDAVHQYDEPKQYQIKIWGDFPRILFNNSGDKEKIKSIDQWGSNKWSSMAFAFWGCSNLQINATDHPDFTQTTSLRSMFRNCSSITIPDFSSWNVSTITAMEAMFSGASNFNGNITTWDVGSVIDFSSTFAFTNVFNQDISSWNVGEHVSNSDFINMDSMFRRARAFNRDLSNWDVSKANTFSDMFRDTEAFDQPLADWDISGLFSSNALNDMFRNTVISRENYDATLIGWATLDTGETQIPRSMTLGAYELSYCLAEDARNILKNSPYFWNINDAGIDCDEIAFITTWETTSPDESITIPTTGSGYNYSIDWGDGTIENNKTNNATHQYDTPKQYQIKIWGDFPRIYFSNLAADKDKILSIDQWGTIKWTSMQNAFFGCSKLTIADGAGAPDLSKVTVLNNMFADSGINTTGNLNSWDVSNVRSFYRMFISCPNFNQPLDQWDVSNADSLRGIFHHAINFNQDITSWNVGKCRNFSEMFLTADDRTHLFNQDISGWNVGEFVTDTQNIEMYRMFKNAKNFDADLSGWDVSRVTSFFEMFYNTLSFDYNLGNWDISNASDMGKMFQGVTLSKENYDNTLIGWATLSPSETAIPSDLTFDGGNSTYCFGVTAKELLTSDTYKWNITDQGTTCNSADFFNTTWQTTSPNESITIPTIEGGYNYDVDWGDGTTGGTYTGNAIHEYATAGIYEVRITGDFPRIHFDSARDKDKIQSIDQWGSIVWQSFESAFRGCTKLTYNATDAPNLSQVKSLDRMFNDCNSFDAANLNDWEVSTVESMEFLFSGATVFNGMIDQWDVSKVEQFVNMFSDALAFNQDISNWTINNNKNVIMAGMFASTEVFNQPIGKWDVSRVTSVKDMFLKSEAFDYSLASWDISNMIDMGSMLDRSEFSQANYDATLIGWATLEDGESKIPTGITLDVDATYCLAEEVRALLTGDTYKWTINDEGKLCESDAFITTWQINSSNEEIVIPVPGTGLDFDVDWGDGMITNESEEAYHTYVSPGTYTIRVLGDFQQIRFNGNADRRKILTIEQWGSNQWTSMESAFKGCSLLEINARDVPDLSIATSMESMFENGACIDNGGSLGNWDVSHITIMDSMFRSAYMVENINSWDVSSVRSIDYIFSGNEDFNEPLDQWDTRNIESAVGAFSNMKNFDQSLGDWDISKASDFTDIFTGSGNFSTTHYDATLKGWATLDEGETAIPTNVMYSDAGLTYCAAAYERNELDTTYQWNIVDNAESACENESAFITTWSVADGNLSIEIPTTGDGYFYTVDWGDSTSDTAQTANAPHTYTASGTYTVTITGSFPRIYFNNSGDKDKIIEVNQWGTQQWTSMESAFYGCTNLIIDASDTPDLANVTSLRAMFRDNTNLIDVQGTIANWDVKTIVDLGQMFMNTDKFNTTLKSWFFRAAEDLSEMFRGAKMFNQLIGFPYFAKTFEGMFRDAIAFNQPIYWTTPEVITLKDMFNGATSFDQNLRLFKIQSVTDMTGMFSNAGLSTQNYDQTLSGWFLSDLRPSDVTFDAGNSKYCLAGDIKEQLTNTYGWQITDGGSDCDENDVFVMTWDLSTERSFNMPTSGDGYDYTVHLSTGDIYHITSDGFGIGRSENLGMLTVRIYGDFPRFDFDKRLVDKEKLATIEHWGSLQLLEADGAFDGCTNLVLNADDVPDLSQLSSTAAMFRGCTSLVDSKDTMKDWDLSTIQNTSSMFENCTAFNEPIGNWAMDSVEDMEGMFQLAIAFNQDISNWDVSNVTNFEDLFLGATDFNQSLANWDISAANDMDDMLVNSGMTQENYDATLIGWATLDTASGETQIPENLTLDVDATYCLAEDARALLTSDTYKWTINDGGLHCTEEANINVYLLGAALNPKTGEEQLMRDDLRRTAVMPTTSPYADAIRTRESILDNTSNTEDTIVDWVWVELRDPNDSTILIEGRSALLQRDGHVVDIEGNSPIDFVVDPGAYYVVVNHRNHLAIRSKDPIIFDGVPVPIDFSSSPSTIEGGLNAVTQLPNGKYAMYAGDVDGNGQTQNSDITNARNQMGTSGYNNSDADMNGQIQNTDINSIIRPCVGKAQQF